MSGRARARRGVEADAWLCPSCRAGCEVVPLSVLLGFARRHGHLELVDAVTELLAARVGREQLVTVCGACSRVAPARARAA